MKDKEDIANGHLNEEQVIPTKKRGTFKKRLRRVIKTRPHLFVIFVISIIGFCYHFNIALRGYLEYKTTVSFSHEDPKDYKFEYPGVTVCLPDVIPYYKLIQQFPDYLEAVNGISNQSKTRNDPNFWTKAESVKFNKYRLRGNYCAIFFNYVIY